MFQHKHMSDAILKITTPEQMLIISHLASLQLFFACVQ